LVISKRVSDLSADPPAACSRAAGQLLEITETTLVRDPDAIARRLAALKRLGMRVAIDDFGTGCSSLGYLRQFPVNGLKIDRTFIKGIAGSKESAALIHTFVQLGKHSASRPSAKASGLFKELKRNPPFS
jgi:EAL domain-containing protein (putative c-di-GMP-specific phosphodiesterase class I)